MSPLLQVNLNPKDCQALFKDLDGNDDGGAVQVGPTVTPG